MEQIVKNKLAVANVISALMKNPQLVLDDRFPLSPDDFPERFHKIVFAAIDHIAHSGAKVLDEIVVDDYLAQYPQQHKVFEDNGGMEYLQRAMEISESANYEYYHTALKKCSLLNQLADQGYDIRKFYDPDAMTLEALQSSQTNLDQYSLSDIVDYYDMQISALKSKFCSDSDVVECHIAKGMRELKNELSESPSWGLPMNSAIMTTICHGRRLKKFYLKSLSSGLGKALVNSTLIPTYDRGMQRVDAICPGDRLIGRNGQPTTVLAVHPQPEKKQVYRVHFRDGRTVDCCKDHLWCVKDGTQKLTLSTGEILTRALEKERPFYSTDGEALRFKIPVCSPVHYEAKTYAIPPYIMGLMLGDGSFREGDTNKSFQYSSENDILPRRIAEAMGWDVHKNKAQNYTYSFSYPGAEGRHKNVWVSDVLADFPELINCYSHDKFIPEPYMYGSEQQRLELLQGLLDTDGHICSARKGRVSLSTGSHRLAQQVVDLVRSMGWTARLAEDRRDKYACGVCYMVHIQCPKHMKPFLFTLPRKQATAMEYAHSARRKESRDWLAIVNIEPLDIYEDMTCFTVDAPDALFLCNDYIVTHNTRISIADACRLAISQYYDPDTKKWIQTTCESPVLFITTELELNEIQTMLWAYVACVPEEHILDNKYVDDEEDRVEKAIQIVENSKFYAVYIANFDMEDIESIIKRHKIQYGIEYVFHDYIFTSAKIFTEMSNKAKGFKLREDQSLMVFSDKLKSLCNKYNIHIDSSTQTNDEWKNTKNPDQSVIRGARAIADKVDIGFIGLEPSEKDKEAIGQIMPKLGMAFNTQPNLVYHVYKVRRGKYNHVKVFIHFDYGTLRTTDMFVTDRDYHLLDIKRTNIEVVLEQTDMTEEAKKLPPVPRKVSAPPVPASQSLPSFFDIEPPEVPAPVCEPEPPPLPQTEQAPVRKLQTTIFEW